MELSQKLESEIEKASWIMLKEHHQRGSVYLVDSTLKLSQVGQAAALDKSDDVKNWLEKKLLSRPSDTDIQEWLLIEKEEYFNFLIIQPYVFIQKNTFFSS